MPFDGPRADEQTRADLGVGEAVLRQPGDLQLLGRECVTVLGGALASGLARGLQLTRGAVGEPRGAHRRQLLDGRSEVLARVDAAALAAPPLAVAQGRACLHPR